MLHRKSAAGLLAAVMLTSSSGCFAFNLDVNGDGAITMDDFDALFAGCQTSDDGTGGGDGTGTDTGGMGDQTPDAGTVDDGTQGPTRMN